MEIRETYKFLYSYGTDGFIFRWNANDNMIAPLKLCSHDGSVEKISFITEANTIWVVSYGGLSTGDA